MPQKRKLCVFKLLALALFLVSCNQKSSSTPQFNYKKTDNAKQVAKVADEIITYKDLSKGIESELFEAEERLYELKYNRLKALILEKIINKHPDKKNLSNDEFLDKIIAKDIVISEKQIEDFIRERKIPQEHLNAQFKERIRNFLSIEKKRVAIDNWMAKETKNIKVEINLAKPLRPWFDVELGDAPVIGSKDAKVTIIEFSDFQCPHCQKGSHLIKQIREKYNGKVKIAFRNFPMPFHSQAKGAAEASLCAKEQGNDYFWKMHDVMFDNQSKLDPDSLNQLAKKIGLNTSTFKTCLDSKKFQQYIQNDMDYAESIGVKATPTFFVNGRMINGAQPLEVFSEVIESELSMK